MPSTMTNNPSVQQKALRVQFSPTDELPTTRQAHRAPVQANLPSILRKGQDSPPMTNFVATATQSDPLQSETYFQGPFCTLISSVENGAAGTISVHDLAEAYILLSCRIEAQAPNLEDDSSPAVLAIRNLTSHKICSAVRRDVAYAIHSGQGPDEAASDDEKMTEEERVCVRDRSSLCHAALRFLSNLFRLPSLYRVLKLHELAWILKELLDIGLSNDLLTVNSQKTYSHVICILKNQRLQDSVLRPFRSKIALVVERAASGAMEGTMTSGPHVDGLRTVSYLLHRNGFLLFSEFHTVFKVTLQNLVCPVPAFRDLAAIALTAFSHAVLRNQISVADQLKFSTTVGAFIDKEVQRAKNSHKSDSNAFVLRDFMKLSEHDPRIIQRVTQLLNIIAALLVLTGPCVFIRPNSLKFLIKAVGKTQKFRYRELNFLRAATWSCLVRAYGLLSSWHIAVDAELKESAFRVVRQEYREDVGISVIAILLGPIDGGLRPLCRVQEAVTYLFHLGQMPETRDVAVALLRRLLGGALNDADSDTCTWTDPASVIPIWLSDGSTLQMEPRKLKKLLTARGGIDMHAVTILEADELTLTWESLVEAFQICAIGQLFDKKMENALRNDTLLLWQALLKVQNALVDTFSRDVVTKSILSCLATTLCSFLDSTHARYPIKQAQALTATHQLWKCVNDQLGEVWGAALAGSIYRRLLKIWQYEVGNSDEWMQLSRSLIDAAPRRTLEVLRELHDDDVQRIIWLNMVRHVRFKERPSKEVISYLLLHPIQTTENVLKDETDFGYWDMLLLLSLMHNEPEIVYASVSEELGRALSHKTCTELRKFFSIAVVHASRSDAPPSLGLLSVVGDYLEEAYPPEDCDDNELTELIPALQRIILAYPSLDVIKSMKNGLMPWFKDRKVYLQDVVYNNDVLSLYCDLFSVAHKISSIEDAIVDMAELIAAPFARERIPEPAVGPIAFKEFWDSVAPTLKFDPSAFPAVLADCVICLHNAFGGYIPEWMESQLDSQITHSSEFENVVPPSIEDVESSDFSPFSGKRNANGKAGTPKVQRVKEASAGLQTETPAVSPSVGDPSPQFARYSRNVVTASPALSLDLERVKKKRRVQRSASTGKGKETISSDDSPEVHFRDILPSPMRVQIGQKFEQTRMLSSREEEPLGSRRLEPQEDYTAWELELSSQDVRNALRDGDRTPRPEDFSPESRLRDRNESSRMLDACGISQLNTDHRIDRSQTAPASLRIGSANPRGGLAAIVSDQDQSPSKLRRTHTTTEVPLDALEKLHARLAAEAGYMQTQDLAQATKLTYDVLGILNGRMSEKVVNRK